MKRILFIVLIAFMNLNAQIQTGAEQFSEYIDLLKDKKVALVVNHTSFVGKSHLLDTLRHFNINIVKIFAPEHGFRGDADAGEHINNSVDKKTGLPIISLYGENKKPSISQLSDVDVVVFDIQDVGCRFYTYLSTMVYVMEACAEFNKKMILLDRPNPNGMYVDGPVLDIKYKSFVGLLPIPIIHGMTLGELAKMVNGEKWLQNGRKTDLEVIKVSGYNHADTFDLPIPPSPNLPNAQAIRLYPSLCLFEGTKVSVGRGTDFPFQTFGHPAFKKDTFKFFPKPNMGAKNPLHKNQLCGGMDLRNYKFDEGLTLRFLMIAHQRLSDGEFFDNISFFDKLAGSDKLRRMLVDQKSEKEIKKSWQKDIAAFMSKRKKYLLYP
jgi:uncharacterized protein YbbC (DUF1343 family)